MVELEALGAVRRQQQQSSLAAAGVSAPFCEPFNERRCRYCCAAGFEFVFFEGLGQQVDPWSGLLAVDPCFEVAVAYQGSAVL